MARHLAYCQNCDREYVVETNGFGVAVKYEEIPEGQKEIAHTRRLRKPGSDLYVFGGCPECKKPGWSGSLEKTSFRGLV